MWRRLCGNFLYYRYLVPIITTNTPPRAMCKLAWLRFRVFSPGVLQRSCAVATVCADDADDDLWMITCGFSSLLPSGSVITVEEVYCISGRNVIYAKQLFMFFFFVCLFPSRRRTMLTNSVLLHGSLLLFPGRWCWRYKDGRGGRRRRKYKPRLIASQSDSGNVIEWVGGWEQKPRTFLTRVEECLFMRRMKDKQGNKCVYGWHYIC